MTWSYSIHGLLLYVANAELQKRWLGGDDTPQFCMPSHGKAQMSFAL